MPWQPFRDPVNGKTLLFIQFIYPGLYRNIQDIPDKLRIITLLRLPNKSAKRIYKLIYQAFPCHILGLLYTHNL